MNDDDDYDDFVWNWRRIYDDAAWDTDSADHDTRPAIVAILATFHPRQTSKRDPIPMPWSYWPAKLESRPCNRPARDIQYNLRRHQNWHSHRAVQASRGIVKCWPIWGPRPQMLGLGRTIPRDWAWGAEEWEMGEWS